MKRSILPAALVAVLCAAQQGRAADLIDKSGERAARCLEAASATHRVPLGVLLILLQVEGGSLGHVSQNSNGTVDIGPMQVNSIWVTKVAAHWNSNRVSTYDALRDSFCANIEAGAWILRQSLDEAHGDFWDGVGFYHSHDPYYKADYLRKVLATALRLQAADARPPLSLARN